MMWPFSGPKKRWMQKVTLDDGQEFVDAGWEGIIVGRSGVRINLGNDGSVFYPLHRVLDARIWQEEAE